MSTLWTPLRSFLSIAALAPIPGVGISMAQALLLAGLSLSNYGANQIFYKTIDYMKNHGGQLVAVVPGDLSDNIFQVAIGATRSQATQIYLAESEGLSLSSPSIQMVYDAHSDGSGVQRIIFETPPITGFLGLTTPGSLGEITIECQSQTDALCVKRTDEMVKLVYTTFDIAFRAVHHADGTFIHPNEIVQAVDAYNNVMKTEIGQMVRQSSPNYQVALNNFAEESKREGWIMLGAWYWTLSGLQENVAEAIKNEPVYHGTVWHNVSEFMLPDYDDVMEILADYESISLGLIQDAAQVHATIEKNANGSPRGIWNTVQGYFNYLPSNGLDWIIESLTKGDPIANLKDIGDTLIDAAEIALVSSAVGDIVIKLSPQGRLARAKAKVGSKIDKSKWASAIKDSGIPQKAGKAASMLASLIAIPIFIMGLFFAYYLPALPFILWMAAVAGLMVLMVEVMVAAPIWFVAHAIPEGDGIAGQHGRQGYMMYLSVIFRAPLMVIGFFASYVMIHSFSWLIGRAVQIFFAGFIQLLDEGLGSSLIISSGLSHSWPSWVLLLSSW